MSKSPDAFRTISEVAEDLDLPQHVLRFWETRFGQIRPRKRGGGRRYYRPDDVDLLRGIRHLLYGEGYTIRGVQRILKEQGPRFVVGAGRGEVAGLVGRGDANGEANGHNGVNGHDEDYIEPTLDGSAGGETDGVPEVEIDRDDHDPDDDSVAPVGMVGAARRFVGQLMEGRIATAPEGGMPADDVHRLQATLADLLECKRILDSTR